MKKWILFYYLTYLYCIASYYKSAEFVPSSTFSWWQWGYIFSSIFIFYFGAWLPFAIEDLEKGYELQKQEGMNYEKKHRKNARKVIYS